jgi:hypothetical protein
MWRLPVFIAAFALTLPGSATAQRRDSVSIPLHRRVRVQLSDRAPSDIIGGFARSDSASVYILHRTGDTLVVPWTMVRQVDMDVRRFSRTQAFWRGARVGAVVSGAISAAGIAYAIYYDTHDKCYDCFIPVSVFAVPAGVAFTITGTVLGGLIGLPLAYRWERVWPD